MVGKRQDGSHLNPVISHVHGPIVAAGAGDATEVTGATIDRQGFDNALALITRSAVLTTSATLSLGVTLQESADGSAWADAAAAYQPTVANLVEGVNEIDVVALDIDLLGLKRYVRLQTLPNLSAGSADTAEVACVVVLGGATVLPAAASTVITLPA